MKNNSVSRDQEIGASITAKLGLSSEAITYDGEGNAISLDLSPESKFRAKDLSDSNARNVRQFGLLPSEIWQLVNLQTLILDSNQLRELPPEIWHLVNLQYLSLHDNQLSHLPPEIGQLVNLKGLNLYGNQLSHLPPEIGQLVNLQNLFLHDNQLRELPSEIGQLVNLQNLFLGGNKLRNLPVEIGQLPNLSVLLLDDNPQLLSPPPEITARGTSDILTFLRELYQDSFIRYEAKLLIVGEGGTGKSSLLRKLRDENLDPNLSTTHGIEVGHLTLPHPDGSHKQIILNTWDFGGQQIYHATHQFFLTRRSVYLVVWNARLGADQGRLNYWLDEAWT